MFLVEHRVFLTIRIVNKVLVSSGSRGPGPPLIFRPNWAEKNFWPKGLDDRPPSPPPPHPAYLKAASGTFGDAELIIIYVSLSVLR